MNYNQNKENDANGATIMQDSVEDVEVDFTLNDNEEEENQQNRKSGNNDNDEDI